MNYDESEDEDNVELNGNPPLPLSAVLPVDQDDSEIDLCSEELFEILADGPVVHVTKSRESDGIVGQDTVEEEEAGGDFELGNWV